MVFLKGVSQVFSVALILGGCGGYTALTPADLTQLGTRTFEGCTVAQVSEGSAMAFETLGYKVTRRDSEAGVVKTAPRVVFSAATGTATHREGLFRNQTTIQTTTQRDEISWTMRGTAGAKGVRVVVSPRAYRNGTEQTGLGVFAKEIMDPHFQQVWREIEDELRVCR